MIDRFLNFLRRRGRAYALVDFFGDVQMYRFFPLWVEPQKPTRWWHWLPNAMFHVFPGEPGGTGPDGASPHSHPWTAVGLVLRGWYAEIINEVHVRVHSRFSLAFTSHRDEHRITSVAPNTLTIFFHWFRARQDWQTDQKACTKLCEQCSSQKLTACPKSVGVRPFSENMESGTVHHGEPLAWVKMTPDFEDQIANRKRVLKRKFKIIPITNAQKQTHTRMAAAAAAVKELS